MEKNRNWTFIVYPDSAPDNWFDILQDTGLPFAVSPLHDKDVDPTGETKKPHYHILVCFPGPTTFNKVNTDICSLLNSPIPKRVLSIVGIYRYFTHKDNPDKYQYSDTDIRVSNGFDIADYNVITSSQLVVIIKAIQKLIIDKKIYEYSDLIDMLSKDEYFDFFNIACTHTLFFDRYLSSRRNKKKDFQMEVEKRLLHR